MLVSERECVLVNERERERERDVSCVCKYFFFGMHETTFLHALVFVLKGENLEDFFFFVSFFFLSCVQSVSLLLKLS